MTNQPIPRILSVLGPVVATLIVTAGLAITSGTVHAEEPTAASLLDAYVEAMGGKAVMERIDAWSRGRDPGR